jgi:hypothetical protein
MRYRDGEEYNSEDELDLLEEAEENLGEDEGIIKAYSRRRLYRRGR